MSAVISPKACSWGFYANAPGLMDVLKYKKIKIRIRLRFLGRRKCAPWRSRLLHDAFLTNCPCSSSEFTSQANPFFLWACVFRIRVWTGVRVGIAEMLQLLIGPLFLIRIFCLWLCFFSFPWFGLGSSRPKVQPFVALFFLSAFLHIPSSWSEETEPGAGDTGGY